MMMSASGRSATAAFTAWKPRRMIEGRRFSTGTRPITAISDRGKRLLSPSRSIACPPTPRKETSPPSRARKARMSFAPS